MYIPFQQRNVGATTTADFLKTVRADFDTAMQAYERTVQADHFGEDVGTLKFSFEAMNGHSVDAVLEDAEEYTNN